MTYHSRNDQHVASFWPCCFNLSFTFPNHCGNAAIKFFIDVWHTFCNTAFATCQSRNELIKTCYELNHVIHCSRDHEAMRQFNRWFTVLSYNLKWHYRNMSYKIWYNLTTEDTFNAFFSGFIMPFGWDV